MNKFESFLTKSRSWEIELTTRCNSYCVGCSRFENYYYPNSHFNSQLDLSIENLTLALNQSNDVEEILMCGVYGDPLLHTDIFEVLDVMKTRAPNARRIVHTNASFGNEEFWKRLAPYFNHSGSHIKFSIDGNQESHELFRRGTKWEKILENAKVFIDAGGNAAWKMIEFAHNKNEIEDMRKLSNDMGFKKFDLRKNNYAGLDAFITNEAIALSDIGMQKQNWSIEQLNHWNMEQIKESSKDSVECRSMTRENLYLDVHGSVWPCCWVGSLPFRPEDGLRALVRDRIFNKYEEGFNNLQSHSLKEIINHHWYKTDLEASWSESAIGSGESLSTCLKTCGKCKT